jgi:uncharacterized protein YbjT (DUF2867 family)
MMLITGATGNVGRPLVEALVRDGVEVAAVTRDPDAAFPPGVRVVADSIPWAEITGVFVNPRAVGDAAAGLLATARHNGVTRVVGLSANNVDEPLDHQPSRANGDRNKEVEQAVVSCGLPWVSLRASVFAPNSILTWGAQIALSDVIRGAYPTFTETPVDPADLAEVAAHVLCTGELDGTKPVLTGPESLTQERMVAIIGTAIGRDLRYQEMPPELVRQAMMSRGFPADFVDGLLARQARGVDRPALPTDEIARILGRPPRTFAQWAIDNADAFTSVGVR